MIVLNDSTTRNTKNNMSCLFVDSNTAPSLDCSTPNNHRGVEVIHFGLKRSGGRGGGGGVVLKNQFQGGGVELNYQILDPEEPTLASQNKLKVSHRQKANRAASPGGPEHLDPFRAGACGVAAAAAAGGHTMGTWHGVKGTSFKILLFRVHWKIRRS